MLSPTPAYALPLILTPDTPLNDIPALPINEKLLKKSVPAGTSSLKSTYISGSPTAPSNVI